MRTVDEANTAAKRKQIMVAAMRCFARLGLQRTSMKDICRETRMTPGHLYYYFPNKNAIMEALFEIGTSEHINQIEHMLDGGTLADAIIERHREHESLRREWNMSPGLRLEFFAEAARDQGLHVIQRDLDERLIKALETAIQRGRAAAGLTEGIDEAVLARIIMLIWTGLGTLRADRAANLSSYEEAVTVLLNSWLLKARSTRNQASVAGGRTVSSRSTAARRSNKRGATRARSRAQ
jgi:TetR/AcrR family transcriptional regulator, repressor for uid operon